MNILPSFVSWQIFNYLQGYTLSVSNNYLLAFVSKLYIISNFIYKLSTIIYKLVIISKGCNNPYKQGPATPSTHHKYQVPSYSLDMLTLTPTSIHNSHIHLYSVKTNAFTPTYILILSYSPKSYTYLSIKVICFASSPSCPPNKGHSQPYT